MIVYTESSLEINSGRPSEIGFGVWGCAYSQFSKQGGYLHDPPAGKAVASSVICNVGHAAHKSTSSCQALGRGICEVVIVR